MWNEMHVEHAKFDVESIGCDFKPIGTIFAELLGNYREYISWFFVG